MNPITLFWRACGMLNELIAMIEDIIGSLRDWTKASKAISSKAAKKWEQSYDEVPKIEEDSK